MKRRILLELGLSSLGGVLLSDCVQGQRLPPSIVSPNLTKNYTSQGGLLDINVEAYYNWVTLGGKPANLMTYNGQVPGPKLEAKPGDTIRIRLRNNLTQPTNLHYHGLHIAPTGNADNIFLSIPPKEQLTYEFTLPKDHPSGTFWYHPHRHGFTAEQLFAGLAGLFIVRGELDEIPQIKAAKEEFLVLQDFGLDNNGNQLIPHHRDQMIGREGSLVTLNGQVNPTLSIPRGGLLRLRLLNASPSRFYRLSLENHPLYLIATDGGSIAEPVELPELLLTPGERADVLIKGDREPQQYRLLNLPYDRFGMGMMGGGMMGGGMMGGGMMGGRFNRNTRQVETLATLVYQGSTSPLPLPKQLLPVEPLPEPKFSRSIELSSTMMRGMGMAFLFNGQPYDHERIDTQVKINTVEDWELINRDRMGMEHPFHLHINPFQIISRNGQPEPYVAWKDVVLVRPGEPLKIRIHFKDFVGKTVYHCHIFDHEDLGMMATIQMTA
ncbi:multicopper oxidase type 3 [Rippkaea orientalis PCC 8801]|uniref:Multicopper oxidase type 3 n=1 Tax=Rippkaea orientalis (strain PCC 8801 / RF-1) TaxID=41431 RepID=B7JV73_RIPO1|nr:multicopper oxidase family protein [Rippkaea orientalis]ACK68206.1 multicopper oxidase type 3 [Rippkaea orientalis PCC 8801]